MWRNWNSPTQAVIDTVVQPLWKTAGQFLRKLNIEIPCDPSIPVLSIHPEGSEKDTQTKLVHKCS